LDAGFYVGCTFLDDESKFPNGSRAATGWTNRPVRTKECDIIACDWFSNRRLAADSLGFFSEGEGVQKRFISCVIRSQVHYTRRVR